MITLQVFHQNMYLQQESVGSYDEGEYDYMFIEIYLLNNNDNNNNNKCAL